MTRSIADIIDLAINEQLWDGRGECNYEKQENFSCDAIRSACNDSRIFSEVDYFTRGLGCQNNSDRAFDEIMVGEERQYARALWLTWAAMIAREEGL